MQDNQNVPPFTPEQIQWLKDNLKLSNKMEYLGIGISFNQYVQLNVQNETVSKTQLK